MAFNENNIILIDNGAGRCKFGRYTKSSNSSASMPNCTARIPKQMQILMGDDIDYIANGSLLQYSRPFDRGYLNNWGVEIDIWNRMLSHSSMGMGSNTNLGDYSLMMTEPPFNPDPWQDETNEVVFEYFGFNAYLRRPAGWFSAYNHYLENPMQSTYPQSSLIIDSGFSFTHILPFIDMKCIKPAVCRQSSL
jgi:actin-related protein 6